MSIPTHESYLVIGGATSIGIHIVEQLIRRGETRVAIFDAQPLTDDDAALVRDTVRTFLGDILTSGSVHEALTASGATCVIHVGMVSPEATAACGGATPLPPKTPAEQKAHRKAVQELHKQVNTVGMNHVLAAVLESETVTKFVYVSQANVVYDGRDQVMIREADAPYPAQCWDEAWEGAWHGERMVLSFDRVNGLRTAAIRPAPIYGPSDNIASTFAQIQANPCVLAWQVGENTHETDQTFQANAAHAALLAADRLNPSHPQHAATAGRAFFISDGSPRPFWDFIRTLWAATGGNVPPPKTANKGAVMFFAGFRDMLGNLAGKKGPSAWKRMQFVCNTRTYDISLAREVLGYAPIVSHDEGIRRTAEWWLERQLKICRAKRETASDEQPPSYDREETAYVAEKGPFL